MPGGALDGKFDQEDSAVCIDGAFEDCAAFALWFRSLVPPEQPLVFYDEGLNFQVALSPHTTVADIVSAVE